MDTYIKNDFLLIFKTHCYEKLRNDTEKSYQINMLNAKIVAHQCKNRNLDITKIKFNKSEQRSTIRKKANELLELIKENHYFNLFHITSDIPLTKENIYKNMIIGIELEGLFRYSNSNIQEFVEDFSCYHSGDYNKYKLDCGTIIDVRVESDSSLTGSDEFEEYLYEDREDDYDIIYAPMEIIFRQKPYDVAFKHLQAFLEHIGEKNYEFDNSTGCHIHFSIPAMFNDTKKICNKDIIVRFIQNAKNDKKLTPRVRNAMFRTYSQIPDSFKTTDILRQKKIRDSAINLTSNYNTIELRYVNIRGMKTIPNIIKSIKTQIGFYVDAIIDNKTAKHINYKMYL